MTRNVEVDMLSRFCLDAPVRVRVIIKNARGKIIDQGPWMPLPAGSYYASGTTHVIDKTHHRIIGKIIQHCKSPWSRERTAA